MALVTSRGHQGDGLLPVGAEAQTAFSNKFIHLGLGVYRKPWGSCHHQLAGVRALVDGRDCLRQLLAVIPHGPVHPLQQRGDPRDAHRAGLVSAG